VPSRCDSQVLAEGHHGPVVVCAVEGCKPVICLQAFVFANPLDVSSDGGGQIAAHVMTMTCTRSLNLSAVVSQVGAMPHVLAFHKTFGGTLMALCPLVQLSLPGKGTCASVMSLHFFNLSLISDRFIALTCRSLHLIVVILVLTQ